MDLLISFVNQSFTPDLKLGVLDTESGDFRWIIDGISDVSIGATGLAVTDRLLYVCAQQSDIVVLSDCGLQQRYAPSCIGDPHSLQFHNGRLLCVSTATNEIYSLDLDESGSIIGESLYWRAPVEAGGFDEIHLNSLLVGDDAIYVTAFGAREVGQSWSDIQHGYVMKLPESIEVTPVRHPHSLYRLSSSIAYCESLAGTVQVLGSDQCFDAGGYTRAIATSGDLMFVGSSHRRKLSKSTGRILKGRVGELEDPGECRVTAFNVHTRAIERVFDLSAYANEIYEIVAAPPNFVRALSVGDAMTLRIRSYEKHTATMLGRAEELMASEKLDFREKNNRLFQQLEQSRAGRQAALNRVSEIEPLYLQLQKEYKITSAGYVGTLAELYSNKLELLEDMEKSRSVVLEALSATIDLEEDARNLAEGEEAGSHELVEIVGTVSVMLRGMCASFAVLDEECLRILDREARLDSKKRAFDVEAKVLAEQGDVLVREFLDTNRALSEIADRYSSVEKNSGSLRNEIRSIMDAQNSDYSSNVESLRTLVKKK